MTDRPLNFLRRPAISPLRTKGGVPPHRIALRAPTAAEERLVDRRLRGRWTVVEARLASRQTTRLVVVDDEIIGATSMVRGHYDGPEAKGLESMTAAEFLSRVERRPGQGRWAIGAGLCLDPRLGRRYGSESLRHFLFRAGPLHHALFATRHGLDGYLSAVVLSGIEDFSLALTPSAYVQQVQAGAIDEPMLSAHLHYGARPVAVVDTDPFPLVGLRWSSSR